MGVHVKSEIGTLKRVMLHRPGRELEQLIPGELERLLFDDIPYLKTARQEHDQFAELLRRNHIEVLYLEDLMAETLKLNEHLKEKFIEEFICDSGNKILYISNNCCCRQTSSIKQLIHNKLICINSIKIYRTNLSPWKNAEGRCHIACGNGVKHCCQTDNRCGFFDQFSHSCRSLIYVSIYFRQRNTVEM